ncbi:MAG: hydroxyacylglutathione hydrolase [Bacteriovoracaceae bacterium]
MIQCERFYAKNDLRNFSYLIYDDKSGDAWVIDPWEAAPFTDYIKKRGLSLQGILNTHSHWDHVRGNDELVRTFNAPVKKLNSSENVSLDDKNELEIIASPGHTMDHQVFLWKGDGAPVIFSGDTLFNAGVGNCKNGGNVDLLFETVVKLVGRLPLDTVLQPGHDYLKRNLEFALSVNPENAAVKERLRKVADDPLMRSPLTFKEELETNPFLKAGKEEFIKLRSLRDKW